MIEFKEYRYIYPPRPELALPPAALLAYDNGKYIAQPKLNGDCFELYTNGKDVIAMDRYNKGFNKSIPILGKNLAGLHRGKPGTWMALVCEYMNKSKSNAEGKVWNHKLVVHDVLVYDGMQLVGKTTDERQELLDGLYAKSEKPLPGAYIDEFLYATEHEDVYRVRNFESGFRAVYDRMVKIDMYEGLVLKRRNAKLENGASDQKNGSGSMFKFRKSTKNYNN